MEKKIKENKKCLENSERELEFLLQRAESDCVLLEQAYTKSSENLKRCKNEFGRKQKKMQGDMDQLKDELKATEKRVV